MNPKELRIGNLLMLNNIAAYHHLPRFESVTTIYEDKAVMGFHYPLSWYKPIPLTEEWLLKFGFKKDKSAFIYGNYALYNNSIYWSGGVYSACDSISNIEIKYVHQLQNLYFALTGEELQIKD